MQTTELIDSIRLLLDDRASSVSAEVLAVEYARQCREVNDRLARIALMLESGGEIQALQAAEQPPRVLDLALALSFGGETAWQEFCRNHGHAVAVLVDARALEALMEIQNKGLAPNHPLYKEYRTAISMRDDGRALDLIRVISRMNPGDENAAKELKRLQRKSLHAALSHLESCLEADEEALLTAMDRVEESGLFEDYEGVPEWKQAVAARVRIRRAEAWQRMPEALAQAEDELKGGEWRQAAVYHEEYAGLAGTYGHVQDVADALEERARVVERELEEHRAEAERLAKARQLVSEMEHITEEVETRIVTPQGLTPDFAGPLVEELGRKLRQHEGLRGDFPGNAKRRIDEALSRLTRTMERSNRAKRIRLVSGITAAVLILLAGATFGALALRASAHADHLASLRGKETSGGLRELAGRIQGEETLLLNFPGLAAEVAQANQWLETMDSRQALIERELAALERERVENFATMASPELFAKLRETGALVSELPADMAGDANTRLTLLRNDGERLLAQRQQENDQLARELAAKWAAVLDEIDPAGPAKDAGDAVKAAPAELEPYLKLSELEHPLLQLPASTASLITDIEARASEILKRAMAVETALSGLVSAQTVDEYRGALASLAASHYAESAAAQQVLDAWPDDERVKAMLVFRGDLVALKATAGDDPLGAPMPEAAVAGDREVISGLLSSVALNQLWEVEWENSRGEVDKCLSKGEVAKRSETSWTGDLASYPQLASQPLNFKELKVTPHDGITLSVNRPTATTTMMSRLALMKLLDDTGTRFLSSVIPLLDSVANDPMAHPLAKAYVYGQLMKLVRNHGKEAWGLQYCPTLIDDMNEFESLAMRAPLTEQSWLAERNKDAAELWEAYFSSRGHRSSFSQLRQTRAAALEALRNPVELVGRIAAEGDKNFQPSVANRLIIGVCDKGEGIYEMTVCGIVDRHGEWQTAIPVIVPYSPLLSIRLAEDSQQFLASIHQSETPEP